MSRQLYLRCWVVVMAAGLLTACKTSTPAPAKDKAKAPAAAANAKAAHPPENKALTKKQLDERVDAHAHFAAGMSFDLRGDSDRALEEFFKAASADPSNDPLVIDVTRRLFNQKEFERALTILTKAGESPKASAAIFALQGLAYGELGRKEQAIAANRKAILLAPNSIPAYRNLVSLYLDIKQPQEALKVLDEASALPNLEAGALLDLVEVYRAYASMQTGEAEGLKPKVTALLDRVNALQPKNPAVLLGLANGYARMGDTAKSSAIFADLVKRFPDVPGLREKVAGAFSANKDYKKAASIWENVLRDNPTDPRPYEELAGIALEAKEFDKAVDYYEKLLLLSPGTERVYWMLAQAQLYARQPEESLLTLEKARQKFSPTFQLEFFSARAATQLKQYTKALQFYTAAEVIARVGATNFLNAGFYFSVAEAHERNKDYKQAETNFRKCLGMEPEFGEALNYLGYMWAERGENLTEARTMIEKAIKLEPENGAFLDSMAWVLFKLNKPKEALEWQLKALVHIDEPDATLYDHLGDIYAALKQFNQAREAWEKSLKIEPSQDIKKKLERLPASSGSVN